VRSRCWGATWRVPEAPRCALPTIGPRDFLPSERRSRARPHPGIGVALFGGVLASALLCLVAAALPETASAGAQAQASYRLRFQLPFLGWSTVVRNNATPTPTQTPVRETYEVPIVGLSLADDLGRRWTVELGTGVVFTSGGLRGMVTARGGPLFTIVDHRRGEGRGSLLQLAGLVTSTYRGHAYHIIAEGGQRTISIGAAAAFEYTYFTSRTFGWSARARPGFSYAIWQSGESVWADHHDGVLLWADGYLMQVGMAVDLGMVF
jgi:hypothetical protein